MISQIVIQDSDRIISVVLKSGLPMFFVLYSTIFNLWYTTSNFGAKLLVQLAHDFGIKIRNYVSENKH